MLLQSGVCAPRFNLPGNTQASQVVPEPGKFHVLFFFPSDLDNALIELIAKFQERRADFAAQGTLVIGVSDMNLEQLKQLADHNHIDFPLLSDSSPVRAVAQKYRSVSNQGRIAPAVIILDGLGLIRKVYESDALPNPAAALRAINLLTNAPMPPPITDHDWKLGSPHAPVTLIEYADYQCGHCRELARLLKQILPAYENQVALVFRHFPLRHSHPLAQLAAEAAEAAGAQGKFWEMHARLFDVNNALERTNLIEYAQALELDVARFTAGLDHHRFADAVEEDLRGATGNRIKFPPTLFVNTILFDAPRTSENLRARIDILLGCLT